MVINLRGGDETIECGTSGVQMSSSQEEVLTAPANVYKFTRVQGHRFHTRVGPDYPKNKLKEPSEDPIYEVLSVDFFNSDKKIPGIGKHLKFPKSPPVENGEFKESDLPSHVPLYLVLCVHYPVYEQSFFGGNEDGKEVCAVTVCGLTKEGFDFLATSAPAANVMNKWLGADDDMKYRARLKCIPSLVNISELDFGAAFLTNLVQKYNAKPFMTGPKCHKFSRGANYLEVNFDMHIYSLFARKATYGMLDFTTNLVLDLAWVVQGNDDEELPERLIAGVRFAHPDFNSKHWRKVIM